MKKYLPLILAGILFIFLHSLSLGLKISDTNVYFYEGYLITQGKILYKDIFFTNFPLFAIISSIYYYLTLGNIDLFYLTSSFEVVITSIFIFIILKDKKENLTPIIAALLYLFSFIILTTSAHQTGVFIASLFSVISYYFLIKEKATISGIFMGLAIMSKAYFIPIFLAIGIYLFLKDRKKILFFLTGSIGISLIILTPFLIFARQGFIEGVYKFSLFRPPGVEKTGVFWFFIVHDPILFALLIFNIFNLRREKFFALVSIFSIIFFILYKDAYYLYLNFFIPFLCISLPNFILFFKTNFKFQPLVISTVIILIILINIYLYSTSYINLSLLPDSKKIIEIIKKEKPNFLYGLNTLTPAFAYETKIPMLDNVYDTNENFFKMGLLDKKILTKEALSKKTLIISDGYVNNNLRIKDYIRDGILDRGEVIKKCKPILFQTLEPENSGELKVLITVIKCF